MTRLVLNSWLSRTGKENRPTINAAAAVTASESKEQLERLAVGQVGGS